MTARRRALFCDLAPLTGQAPTVFFAFLVDVLCVLAPLAFLFSYPLAAPELCLNFLPCPFLELRKTDLSPLSAEASQTSELSEVSGTASSSEATELTACFSLTATLGQPDWDIA